MSRSLIPHRTGYDRRYVRKDLRNRNLLIGLVSIIVLAFGLGQNIGTRIVCGGGILLALFMVWRGLKGSSVYIGRCRLLIPTTLWERIFEFDELDRAEAEAGIYGAMGWPKSLLVLYDVKGKRHAFRDYCSPREEVSDNSAAAVAAIINQLLESYRVADAHPGP